MRIIFLIIFSITISLNAFAQDSLKAISLFGTKWKKGSISFSASTEKDTYYRKQFTFNDLLKNAKNPSAFYNFNKSDFNQYNSNYIPSIVYNLSFSLNPYSNKLNSYNKNHELRIGLVYYRGTENQINFSNKYSRYYNFGNTSNNLAKDTTYLGNVRYSEIVDQLGLEGIYIFRSDEFWKRFSLFAGVGGGFSYSVFSQIKEEIDVYSGKNVSDVINGNTYSYYATTDSYTNNYFKNNNAYAFRGVAPFGINLRFLKTFNFYIEGRSGLSYQKFIHGTGKIRTQYALGAGLRVNL